MATLLRIPGLQSVVFEQDELYTLRDASQLNFRPSANGPGIAARPLYYLLQHVVLQFTSPSELSLRVLPLLFGLMGVWVTWRLARQLTDDTGGIVAAALVALSPWHMYVSGMARYWSLVYLLAAATVLALVMALQSDRPRHFFAAAVLIVLGIATHPTFAFTMCGVLIAAFLIDATGRTTVRRPSRNELKWLWAPLLCTAVAGALIVALRGSRGLHNGDSRGWGATIRIVPAAVEWMTLPVVVAAIGAAALLVVRGRVPERRMGLMTLIGGSSCVMLTLVAGMRTAVYADYLTSTLPLVFVVIGCAVALLERELSPPARGLLAGAAMLVFGAAMAPAVVSNLKDGMRFDYRPAYRFVEQFGSDRLIVGSPLALQRFYAPALRYRGFPEGVAELQKLQSENGGFWLILEYARRGLQAGGDDVQRWADLQCRTALRTERGRLDYRVYRVDLAWCGNDVPPGIVGSPASTLVTPGTTP